MTRSGFQCVAHDEHAAQRLVALGRILGDVRLERDARALEEDHPVGSVVLGGVAVVGVVERREVLRDTDRIAPVGDILEHARVPDALLALAVGAVVIEVAELTDESALADSRTTDDGDTHECA